MGRQVQLGAIVIIQESSNSGVVRWNLAGVKSGQEWIHLEEKPAGISDGWDVRGKERIQDECVVPWATGETWT